MAAMATAQGGTKVCIRCLLVLIRMIYGQIRDGILIQVSQIVRIGAGYKHPDQKIDGQYSGKIFQNCLQR
jgi:hypothetical protein